MGDSAITNVGTGEASALDSGLVGVGNVIRSHAVTARPLNVA